MKRLTNTLLFLTLLSLSSAAQDFKLFYAKNVTDVTNFSSVNAIAKQLTWREVTNGSFDGNRVDVTKVMEMLGSTRMKGLDDQRLFWKMRDQMLLCFRIDDPTGNGSFRVEVNYGKDEKGNELKNTLTTSRYFFANMPLACDMVTIDVWRVKDPTQRINFRYFIYDWDDDNVYIFQLDQKRQSTGDTYKMEYVTSKMDEEGEMQTETKTLELKETKFQSFYVPEDRSLTAVYFLTGNEKEGNVRLRLNMEDIHPNIDIDDQLEIPYLSTKFNLAKHEYRELMNFNWLGTGLFEKYDTLYIKLFNERGKTVSKARMNVHRVDEEGNLISNDNSLYYIGYDEAMGQHKVLTYGHPAYVEILVNGYLPLLYRYKGAADAETKEVSADLCSAKITLKPGNPDAGGIAISDQYFRYLKDEAIAVTRGDIEYALVTLAEENISGKIPSDVVSFMDNGGNDYPKLYNNKPIEKLAQFEVVFSSPKGNSSPQSHMTATEVKSKKSHEARAIETYVVSAEQFKNFTRDYYFVRYDMSEAIPYNQECKLKLAAGTSTYEQFPTFLNIYKDNEEAKKETDKKTKENITPKDGRENSANVTGDMDLGFRLPLEFKFSLPKGITVKTGTTMDFTKQTYNFYTNLTISMEEEGSTQEKKDKLKAARDNAKELQNWRHKDLNIKDNGKQVPGTFSVAEPTFKFDDWVISEMENLFTVQPKHIGWYVAGGAKFSMKMPLIGLVIPDYSNWQLDEVSGYFEFGRGWFLSPDMGSGKLKTITKFLKDYSHFDLDIGLQLDLNARVDFGIKSYGAKKKNPYEWSSEDKGFFTNVTGSVLFGSWATLRTNKCPFASFDFGFRAGAKGQLATGLMIPFSDEETCFGFRAMAVGGIDASFSVRSFIVNWAGRWGFHAGAEFLAPDDNTNPFHPKFPYWLPDAPKKSRLIGNTFRTLRAPEANSLGQPLVNNVFYDANPHFIDAEHVVYNDLGDANDYNDDHVTLATLSSDADDSQIVESQIINSLGTSAGQQMRSKRGTAEVVVYQQTTQAVDNAAITDATASTFEAAMHEHTQIKAAVRQDDGTWKQTVVTPDDGFTDQKPVVTVQEDGKAAVIYQHGKVKPIDETLSVDSVKNQRFEGELLLRTYEPATGWSEPKTVFGYSDSLYPLKYDLIMRNDTVLVGAMLEEPDNPVIGAFAGKYFRYAWNPVKEDQVFYSHEDLHAVDFFMNRVGEHGVISLLYERPDSTREIFIKTLNMDGSADGLAGCDLGIGKCVPYKVKIICDRSSDTTNDFAVLWTEQSTIVRDAENGNSSMGKYYTVLNATRVHLSDAPQLTYPLTMGAERDSLQMGDFDGFLDDASIKVVYTLTDVRTNATVIMQNEKEFTNSFESDVTYSREALLGSSTLPVNVFIRNTGTSAIKAATVTINGQEIAIPDVLVQPMHQERYVVQYPIPADFDGYMQSSVEVEYANVFKARHQLGRRAVARNLLRQSRTFGRKRVAASDIDCNVVSRSVENGVNTFVVEVVDHSSRGLTPGTGVQVGAYVHPSALETVSDEAQTVIHASDFIQMGGVRRAYAEVIVNGVAEAVDGYIAAHVVDLESNSEEAEHITNFGEGTNPTYVVFHPTGEAVNIDNPVAERPKDHRVSVTVQDGGLLFGNLKPSDDVRIFNSAGWTVYMKDTPSAVGEDSQIPTTLFVPLKRHDVYIISAGQEVFKFNY